MFLVTPPDKRISVAYKAALRRHNMTQKDFADSCGFDSSVLTKMAQGQFPNDKTLQALFKGWPDAQTGWEILQAHLLDECERAGAGAPRLVIEERNSDERFLEDLRKMEAFFRRHPDLHSSLQELADILDPGKNSGAEEPVHEVAEAKSSPVVTPKREAVRYPVVKSGAAGRKKR